MKDLEFKARMGSTYGLTRSQLRRWKQEYFKKDRVESPQAFYERVKTFTQKLSMAGDSLKEGQN